MKGRMGQRARTDFPVVARFGRVSSSCRGLELSATGILLDRGRSAPFSDQTFVKLELELPGVEQPLLAVARPVWSFGTQQALKFVGLSDADHLAIAEHVDRLSREGARLN